MSKIFKKRFGLRMFVMLIFRAPVLYISINFDAWAPAPSELAGRPAEKKH